MPTNAGAVAAVLLAVAPGYLLISVWAQAASRTWRGPGGDLRTVLQALLGSTVVHLVVSPVTIWWLYPHREDLPKFPERVVVWAVLIVVVAPTLLGLLASALTKRSPFDSARPSAWDWLFTKCPPYGRFLVIEFDDGRQIAGAYAEGSVAMTSPDRHGLYLCPEWEIDDRGNLTRPVPGNAGLLIPSTDGVRSVRVLEPGDDDAREGHAEAEPSAAE